MVLSDSGSSHHIQQISPAAVHIPPSGKKAKPAATKEAGTPLAETKGARILALIGRPKASRL